MPQTSNVHYDYMVAASKSTQMYLANNHRAGRLQTHGDVEDGVSLEVKKNASTVDLVFQSNKHGAHIETAEELTSCADPTEGFKASPN